MLRKWRVLSRLGRVLSRLGRALVRHPTPLTCLPESGQGGGELCRPAPPRASTRIEYHEILMADRPVS